MVRICKVFLCMFLMVTLIGNTIYAAENETKADSLDGYTFVAQTVTNEYDNYKLMKAKSNSELTKQGYSTNQISYIKEFNYKEEMDKRVDKYKRMSKSDLIANGYTEQQVSAINNYTGSEEQLRLLAASLTLNTFQGTTSSSSSSSYAEFRTLFSWSSEPFFLLDDILAVPWSEGMYLSERDSWATVSYWNNDERKFTKTIRPTIIPDLNKGAYFKFDMGYTIGQSVTEWARQGVFFYKITKQSKVTEVAVQPTYGHTIWAIGSPTVSFPAGLGVSFSWQVQEEAFNYLHIDL